MIVYKYELNWNVMGDGVFHASLMVPAGGKILKVAPDTRHTNVWMLVDPSRYLENREFYMYGTGREFFHATQDEYIDTIFDREYVWHIFEVKP